MSSMLTIGIDIRLLGKKRTGDETVFFHLTRALLRRRDTDRRYVLFTDRDDATHLASLWTRLECLGRSDVEIIALPAANRFVWNAFVLPRYLCAHPIDVLHTQYILPFFLPRQLKVVAHIHDVSFMAHPEWIGWSDRLFLRLLIPRTLRRAEAIIAPSLFTEAELLHYFPTLSAAKVHVIPNAAGEEWSNEVPQEKITAVKEKYGLTDTPYFISSGTMQPRKNVAFLIQAFQQAVSEKGLMGKLVLVGDPTGHNTDPSLAVATKDPHIVFTGYVTDLELRVLVIGSRAYVFPSLYEGFGIPLLEALASGVPVIASDIPPFREVAGSEAQFFDPRSIAGAVNILYNFSIDVSAEQRLQKASSRSNRTYSWQESAEKLASLYAVIAQ